MRKTKPVSGERQHVSDIHLERAHKIGLKRGRAAAQQIADQLAQSFDVHSHWDGDVLRFERVGVDGTLALSKNRVVVDVTLGFLLMAFKPQIEAKVAQGIEQHFA